MSGLIGSAAGGASIDTAKGATSSAGGGGGGAITDVVSPEATINVTDPTGPTVEIDVNFATESSPQAIGAATLGSSLVAIQSDHQHPFPFANGINTGGVQLATNFDATHYQEGAWVWVASVGAWFQLHANTTLTADNITVVNAFNRAGFKWLRANWLNLAWQAQAAWFVNTSTGNDENAGTTGAPLKTLSEAARRLSFAQLTGTVVTLTGNTATTDTPAWTFQAMNEFAFMLTGVPAVIFTGSVTTAVNMTAGPSTTQNTITDTSLPTSFTASGMLAANVMFKRTNGTAVYWWMMLDQGSKTGRISQPHQPFTGDVALANGDTYTASTLPLVRQMSFTTTTPAGVYLQQLGFPAGYVLGEKCYFVERCWFNTGSLSANPFENCLFGGTSAAGGTGIDDVGGAVFNGGAWRSGTQTNFILFGVSNGQINFRTTWQGVVCLCQNGTFLSLSGDMAVFDVSGALNYPITASYWSEVLFTTGSSFSGTNNSNIAAADRMSQIGHVLAANWLAGSSTSGTPINVSGTAPMSVATEAAGGGVINAQQNGIFVTT